MNMLFAICVLTATGTKIDSLSFEAPFVSVASDGSREVPGFNAEGNTDIQKHFVRLTPDRQSKAGTMWSTHGFEPAAAEFSAALTFRISGQASRWFGDGIGWWFTADEPGNNNKAGPLHGAENMFTGFGVIVDTFENDEMMGQHNDVTIFVNNGTRTVEDMQFHSFGCNPSTKLRFHEKRADFAWDVSSRVSASVKEGKLTVMVDVRNTGEWTECVDNRELELPDSFYEGDEVRVGVSASTGGVADNHDVISMSAFTLAGEATTSPNIAGTDGEDGISQLKHHLEHELIHLKESLGNTIGKLQKAEKESEVRIEVLEASLKEKVLEETNAKLMDMVLKLQKQEDESQRTVQLLQKQEKESYMIVQKLQQQEEDSQQRIDALEQRLSSMLNYTIEQQTSSIHEKMQQRLKESSGSWQTPFMILVLALAGGGYGAYNWYQGMRKSHLL
jgi:mannose-binding lectin 2